MASALFSRLFDLMRGFTEPGWFRVTLTSAIWTPSSNTRSGGGTCALTMMTSVGAGQALGS